MLQQLYLLLIFWLNDKDRLTFKDIARYFWAKMILPSNEMLVNNVRKDTN